MKEYRRPFGISEPALHITEVPNRVGSSDAIAEPHERLRRPGERGGSLFELAGSDVDPARDSESARYAGVIADAGEEPRRAPQIRKRVLRIAEAVSYACEVLERNSRIALLPALLVERERLLVERDRPSVRPHDGVHIGKRHVGVAQELWMVQLQRDRERSLLIVEGSLVGTTQALGISETTERDGDVGPVLVLLQDGKRTLAAGDGLGVVALVLVDGRQRQEHACRVMATFQALEERQQLLPREARALLVAAHARTHPAGAQRLDGGRVPAERQRAFGRNTERRRRLLQPAHGAQGTAAKAMHEDRGHGGLIRLDMLQGGEHRTRSGPQGGEGRLDRFTLRTFVRHLLAKGRHVRRKLLEGGSGRCLGKRLGGGELPPMAEFVRDAPRVRFVSFGDPFDGCAVRRLESGEDRVRRLPERQSRGLCCRRRLTANLDARKRERYEEGSQTARVPQSQFPGFHDEIRRRSLSWGSGRDKRPHHQSRVISRHS